MMSKNVLVKIASHANITFHEEEDTGYTREEWAELTQEEQDSVVDECVFSAIDVWIDDGTS